MFSQNYEFLITQFWLYKQLWVIKSELWDINLQLQENSIFFSELDFITHNCEFTFHNSDKRSQNCEFISRIYNLLRKSQNCERKGHNYLYIFTFTSEGLLLPLLQKVYFRRLPVCVFTSEGYQFVTSEGKEWMYLLQKVAQVEESSVVLRVNIQRSPVINFSLLCLVSQGAQIIQSTGMSRVQSIQKHRQFTDLHNQMKALILNQKYEGNWGIKVYFGNWKCFHQQTKPLSVKLFSCPHTHTLTWGLFYNGKWLLGFVPCPSGSWRSCNEL